VACPREIAAQAGEALKLLAWAGEHCRRHLVSDLLVGCEFLGAALKGAHHIALANLPLIRDEDSRRALEQELRQDRREGQDLFERVKEALRAREKGAQ
jgi:formiminotetrahydrofolate cyclodeaminase